MTAKEQINAIASLIHVLKVLAWERPDNATSAEQQIIITAYDNALFLTEKLKKFFDGGGEFTEQEWDATASLEDYAQEENKAIIAAVAKES